mmetsp:Transcript_11266/g.22682  ORF Transcript_11266/g.22682 Transcript_11266/m.22682 type:complete len:219 (-) Transcript_11266:4827-5483(-)
MESKAKVTIAWYEGCSARTLRDSVLAVAPGEVVEVTWKDNDDVEAVRRAMVLAGLVRVAVHLEPRVASGARPTYHTGASVPLMVAGEDPSPNAGFLVVDDGRDSSAVDLVPENEILTDQAIQEEGLKERTECAPYRGEGGRKPCANCSCGRREAYDAEKAGLAPPALDTLPPVNNTSNCGNCALGDAFRCAGCPYLGLPPFKPGEKVALPSSIISSDL